MGHFMPGKRITMFGITFASRDEVGRYLELREKQNYGEIDQLEYEPETFDITVKSKITGKLESICKYTPDFRYRIIATGEIVYEDVKSLSVKKYRNRDGFAVTKKFGTATERDWKIKRKLMLHAMGINVREVLMSRSVRSLIKASSDSE